MCNKTTGAYSGIPGDDMRVRRLKGDLKLGGSRLRAQPLAAAIQRRLPPMRSQRDMCENQ
jgi:hypothetical protein